ncbi:hypothetical protein [Ferrimicrobium sp.]|jgi:hypothetical protein|uniref:hypothetical protein n=1 Tax=Ferrimicrobium sp. TaxID=2926050 RepID=UPI00261D0C7B|nr:hypothetical protein [Ferrimicrobium sp.]
MTESNIINSPSYWLGIWRQRPDGVDYELQMEIAGADFNQCIDDIGRFRALTERHTFQLLQRHWHQIDSMRRLYEQIEQVGGAFRFVDQQTVAVTFMGKVVDWLATSRLYLVSEEERLCALGTHIWKQFRTATRTSFDRSAAYRFLYNLRDYAQHSGPPLGALTIASDGVDGRRLSLVLNKTELRSAHFRWSRHSKILLDDWPTQFDLFPLIEAAMLEFRAIEEENVRIRIAHLAEAIPRMRSQMKRIVCDDGNPCVLSLTGSESVMFEWQTFPMASELGRIEAAALQPDPIEALGRGPISPRAMAGPNHHGWARAAAVVTAYLEHGRGGLTDDVLNTGIHEDQDVQPTLNGLLEVGGVLALMLGTAFGSSAAAILGSLVGGEGP